MKGASYHQVMAFANISSFLYEEHISWPPTMYRVGEGTMKALAKWYSNFRSLSMLWGRHTMHTSGTLRSRMWRIAGFVQWYMNEELRVSKSWPMDDEEGCVQLREHQEWRQRSRKGKNTEGAEDSSCLVNTETEGSAMEEQTRRARQAAGSQRALYALSTHLDANNHTWLCRASKCRLLFSEMVKHYFSMKDQDSFP